MDRSNISNYDQQQEMAPYTEFFSWGSDSHGQLALANSDEDDQNQYYAPQFYEEPKSLSFDILITQISCGDYHAAFISGDGFLFSFGRNSEGQLGVGDPSLQKSSAPLLVDSLPKDANCQLVQVSCGGSHTAVIMTNGDMYSWGSGLHGATGLNTTQNIYAPLKIKATENANPRFSFISCGKKHSMAVDFNGSVFVCGDNSARQLGIQHSDKVLTFKQVPNFYQKALKVAAGVEHSLILSQEGEVFAAGNNQNGNLGLGHNFSSDSFLQVHGLQNLTFVTVSAGRHSAAITNDNRLFVWGPVFLNEQALILPQELRSNKLIKQVSVGEKTTAIIDEDYHLYTWGNINASQQDQLSQDAQMPQFVESLAFKQVSLVEVGLEFIIALGQDFDQNGQAIVKDLGQSDIQIGRDDQYQQPSQISNNSSQYQHQNQQDYRNEDKQFSYQPQKQQSQPLVDYRLDDRSFKYDEASRIQQDRFQEKPQEKYEDKYQDRYQDKYQDKYEPMSQSKPPLKTIDKPLNNSEIEYPKRDQQLYNNQSLISSQSKKSTEQQRKPYDPLNQESSFHSSQVAFDRNNSADRFKQSSLPPVQPQVFNYNSNTNAELYKQIDQLREENFSLKQKQRELCKTLNELKAENDSLLQNADNEIKRMSDFVDKYTQEVEMNKKQLQSEFEERINQERKKADELKKKFHSEQNEIESKLDKLQREIETLRQENLSLTQAKSESMIKQRELQDQLIETNKQLQKALSQQQFDQQRNFSPQGTQTPHQKQQRQFDDRQTTPSQNNVSSRPPVLQQQQQQERSSLKYNTRDQPSEYQYRGEPMMSVQRSIQPSTYNSNSNNKSSRIPPAQDDAQSYKTREEPSKFYTLENKNLTQSPYNQRSQYVPPSRVEREQPPAQYSNAQQFQAQPSMSLSQVQPQYGSQSRYQPISSPPKPHEDSVKKAQPSSSYVYQDTDDRQLEDYRKESFSGMKPQSKYEPMSQKYRQYEVEKSSNPISQRIDQPSQSHMQYTASTKSDLIIDRPIIGSGGKENPGHQRNGSNGNNASGEPNALNDVKNRLMTMQKNKEELEEKLRNYEAKIRQHYNRQ